VSSLELTEDKSVSNTPDFKLSTSMLDTVLLSTSIVLLVNACEPVSVATVLSIAKVTLFVPVVVSIPVPPSKSNTSESKSIAILLPLSADISKSSAVSCVSTYALTDCCVTPLVAELDDISSSSKNNDVFTAVPASLITVSTLSFKSSMCC